MSAITMALSVGGVLSARQPEWDLVLVLVLSVLGIGLARWMERIVAEQVGQDYVYEQRRRLIASAILGERGNKSLGVIVLKKWAVDDEYIAVIRAAGNWDHREGPELCLIDLVNLALFHAIKERSAQAELPLLVELAAYHKLLPPLNFIGDNGELELLVSHRADIRAIAETLR